MEFDLEAARRAISDAALDPAAWPKALSWAAQAAGGHAAHLVGLSRDGVVLNVADGYAAEALVDFERNGGGDPAINPRVGAARDAKVLSAVAENDFIGAEARRRHPFYASFLRRYDATFICMSPLIKSPNLLVVLGALRSETQGHVEAEARKRFEVLLEPFARSVEAQLDEEVRAAGLAAHVLECVGSATFICDPRGRVVDLSPSAERMARKGDPLRISAGLLRCSLDEQTERLAEALTISPGERRASARPPSSFIIMGRACDPVRVDCVPLPADRLPLGAQVTTLVVVRDQAPSPSPSLAVLGLTASEAEIARALADGLEIGEIARRRGARETTVRSQINSLYSKLGVRRQLELARKLKSYL